jgi:hypothetical protein
MIDAIFDAAMAPFTSQVGWQGFAYGLLGLKTLRRVFDWARDTLGAQKNDAD